MSDEVERLALESTSPLSPEQVSSLFEEQRKLNLAGIDKVKESALEYFTKGFTFWQNNFKNVITLQSQELAIFRELEWYINNVRLTTEVLESIISKLAAFREEAQKIYGPGKEVQN